MAKSKYLKNPHPVENPSTFPKCIHKNLPKLNEIGKDISMK